LSEQETSFSEQVEGALRLMLDTLPLPIVEFNEEMKLLYVNRAVLSLTGHCGEELLSGNLILTDLVVLEDRNRLREAVGRALSFAPVEDIALTLITKNGKSCRAEFGFEVLFRRAKGYGARLCITPLERCRTHREQMFNMNSMETVGRLASNMVHDINNMLTVILGHADLAFMQNKKSPLSAPELLETVKAMRDAALRCTDLASEVLSFSKRRSEAVSRTDVHGLINRVARLFEFSSGRGIRTIVDLSANRPHVTASGSKLLDVIVNIIYNARDAMPSGGMLTVASKMETITVRRNSMYGFAPKPGEYLRISVSDTGSGMDAGVKARIFEPFFTTREAGRGSGLGLANVYDTVKNIGGFIEVTSAPDQGTQFDLYLPSADAAVQNAPQTVTAAG